MRGLRFAKQGRAPRTKFLLILLCIVLLEALHVLATARRRKP